MTFPSQLQAASTKVVLQSSCPKKVTIHRSAYRSSRNPFSHNLFLVMLSETRHERLRYHRVRYISSDIRTVLATTQPPKEIRAESNECLLRIYIRSVMSLDKDED
jgi:hypothetical protein